MFAVFINMRSVTELTDRAYDVLEVLSKDADFLYDTMETYIKDALCVCVCYKWTSVFNTRLYYDRN